MFSPGVWWHTEPRSSEGRAMGQVLHGSATTTQAVRGAIQRSQKSVRALARHHGISSTTVQKWRRRQTTADAAMEPKSAHSPVLSTEQEAMIVAFRRHTLLPLDDCLRPAAQHPGAHALQPAPLPATPRHLPAAPNRGRQAGQEALQGLPDRLCPHRRRTKGFAGHRRGPHRAGQAAPVRRR